MANTVGAIAATQLERRELLAEIHRRDADTHISQARALLGALGRLLEFCRRDLQVLDAEAAAVARDVQASVSGKQQVWVARCEALQAEYARRVHAPLLAMQAGTANGERAAALDLAARALSNQTDAQCVRRCELALEELIGMRTALAAAATATTAPTTSGVADPDDDAALQEARRTRARDLAVMDEQHARRVAAVAEEMRARDAELAAARRQLKHLQTQATATTAATTAATSPAAPGTTGTFGATHSEPKRAAAMIRLAQERDERLARDTARLAARIAHLERELHELRATETPADRLLRVRQLEGVVATVYDTCRALQTHCRRATTCEDALRRTLIEQAQDGARSVAQATVQVIQRAVEATRAGFAAEHVRLGALDDRVHETERRIVTLERAYADQKSILDGPEVYALSALEEYLEAVGQEDRDATARVRLDGMLACSSGAVALLNELLASVNTGAAVAATAATGDVR